MGRTKRGRRHSIPRVTGWGSGSQVPWEPSSPSSSQHQRDWARHLPLVLGPVGLLCRSPATAQLLPLCLGGSSGHWQTSCSGPPPEPEPAGGMDCFRRLRVGLQAVLDSSRQDEAAWGGGRGGFMTADAADRCPCPPPDYSCITAPPPQLFLGNRAAVCVVDRVSPLPLPALVCALALAGGCVRPARRWSP